MSDTRIEVMYFLVAVILVPLVLSLMYCVVSIFLFGIHSWGSEGVAADSPVQAPQLICDAIIAGVVITWIGAWAGARFVCRRYVMLRPLHVAQTVTAYFSGFSLLMWAAEFIPEFYADPYHEAVGVPMWLLTGLMTILSILVFHFASRKYLVGGDAQ